MMTKQEARKHVLKKRKELDIKKISNLFVSKIISLDILSKYQNIGIYYPLRYEINLLELINHYKDKNFYLPQTREVLEFVKYNINDTLVDGPYNIKEPIGCGVDIKVMDCILIPCVAITKDMRRIGYGKGYYDKTFANYTGFKIGICYGEFTNLDINADEFDLIMDMVII